MATEAYSFEDPTVYLFTSLTAGSSHIITATSRLETILKANKIPFRAIDVATDDKARMLWGRRSKGKKLPGLVRNGMIVGDLLQIEDWNEFGELKAQIGNTEGGGPPSSSTTAAPSSAATAEQKPAAAASAPATSTAPHIQIADTPSRTSSAAGGKDEARYTSALKQAADEAASKAKDNTRGELGVQPKSSLGQTEEAVAKTAVSSDEPGSASGEPEKRGTESEAPKQESTPATESSPSTDEQERAEIREAARRPSLVDTAVESTVDVHAKNASEEGRTEHHPSQTTVSATLPEEKAKVTRDLQPAMEAMEENEEQSASETANASKDDQQTDSKPETPAEQAS